MQNSDTIELFWLYKPSFHDKGRINLLNLFINCLCLIGVIGNCVTSLKHINTYNMGNL